MNKRLILTCAVPMTLACAERSPPSAGNGAWEVEPEPILDVHDTAMAGPAVLESVRYATRLPNGTLVVADQYADALRFFDDRGRTVRVVGRAGSGPGEFGDVMWVNRCGTDSLYVWDYARRVIIVHDTAGTFVREFHPQGNPHEFTCWRHFFGVLGIPDRYVAPGDAGEVNPAPIWTADAQGDSAQGLGKVPFGENRALGKLTRIAAGPDVLYVGTADSAWVDVYSLVGGRRTTIPVGFAPRSPTQADFAQAIDKLIAVSPNREVRDRFRTTYAALPMPAHLPPYVDLRVDPEGRLWVVEFATDNAQTHLRAIDTTGTVRADVTLPLALTVFEVGLDYVLGAYTDGDDLDHVVVFRLNRS